MKSSPTAPTAPAVIPTADSLRDWITNGSEEPKRNQYPPEAIEPTLNLHSFLFRRCGGNINQLVDHARSRKFNQDYNYYYQVLTGRYFAKNAEGKVQGSAKNLIRLWNELQAFDRFMTKVESIRFVETSVWHRINDYVQRKMIPFSCCRFGGICGPTGNQKTESFFELIRRAPAGTGFHMEAPAEASLSQFIEKLSYQMGARKSDGRSKRRELIRTTMLVPGRFLIVDNVQRCFNKRLGTRQPVFDFMQELQEETRSTTIISWTPVEEGFEEAFGNAYFEQFIGRIGGEREILRIEPYPSDEDIELFAASFRLPEADIDKLMPTLRELARGKGRVRALVNALQSGARLANIAKQDFGAKHLLQYLGK